MLSLRAPQIAGGPSDCWGPLKLLRPSRFLGSSQIAGGPSGWYRVHQIVGGPSDCCRAPQIPGPLRISGEPQIVGGPQIDGALRLLGAHRVDRGHWASAGGKGARPQNAPSGYGPGYGDNFFLAGPGGLFQPRGPPAVAGPAGPSLRHCIDGTGDSRVPR